MDAGTLHAEIAKVCPVTSTKVGVADDRATWSFEPGDGATEEYVAAGQNVIDTIDVDYKAPPEADAHTVTAYDHENRIRALEGQPALTIAQFLVEAKEKTVVDKIETQPAAVKPQAKAKPKGK